MLVSYTLVSGTATLDTDAMTLTPTEEGTVEIKASQAGDDTFNPAPDVQLSIVVIKRNQTIDFVLADTVNVNDVLESYCNYNFWFRINLHSSFRYSYSRYRCIDSYPY